MDTYIFHRMDLGDADSRSYLLDIGNDGYGQELVEGAMDQWGLADVFALAAGQLENDFAPLEESSFTG